MSASFSISCVHTNHFPFFIKFVINDVFCIFFYSTSYHSNYNIVFFSLCIQIISLGFTIFITFLIVVISACPEV